VSNAKALDELFYGVGNALAQFSRKRRLTGFEGRNPESSV